MDTWHQIGTCLDGGLMGALKIEGRSASVGTGKADAAQLVDFSQAGAPAETNKGTEAFGRPGQVAARMGGRLRRRELVVIRGGLAAALPSKLPRQGAYRARAASLRLITIDGVRVHQPTST